MLKYCIKVFDSEDRLIYQLIVPKDELYFHMDNMSSYGCVKVFCIDEDDKRSV